MKHKILLITLLLALPTIASATSVVVPGSSGQTSETTNDYSSSDVIVIPGGADRSFHCRAVTVTGAQTLDFDSSFSSSPGMTAPDVVFRGGMDGGTNNEQTFSFIAVATGTHSINVDSHTGSSVPAQISCFETSLYGGFNTVNAANPVNFLEITNLTTESIKWQAVFYSTAGVELHRTDATIGSLSRTDFGLQDVGALQNTFGSIVLAHDGPVGAIKANISRYTFDGANLDITAVTSLSERVQN